MKGIGDVVVLLAAMIVCGFIGAAWVGWMVAIGIRVARWFL